jgi:hypothetical protein
MTAPKSATHYLPAPDGSPQLWYRVGTTTYHPKHGGETVPILEYFSSFNIWQGSFDPDRASLLAKLIKLPEAAK